MKPEIVEELAAAIKAAYLIHDDPPEIDWLDIAVDLQPLINRLMSEARKEGRREIANAYVSAMRTAKGSGHA